MKNSNYSKAKVLTLIPIIVLAVAVICFVLATVLEGPTDKGALYSVFAFIGLIGMLAAPFPCLILSIIGTVFAAKATKEGALEARKFLILGAIEVLVYIIGVIIAVIMLAVGQGV